MAERRGGGRAGGQPGRRRRGRQRLGHVRWEHFSHRHMWNMIMDARPDDVFERHHEWRDLGRRLVEVNTAVQGQLNTLFTTWRGSAAMTAALGNTSLLAWAQDAAEITDEVGAQLGVYGNALVEARRRMPQPRPVDAERAFRSGDGVEVLSGPENAYVLMALLDDNEPTARRSREARQQAIEVMRAFETDANQVATEVDQAYATPPVAADPDGGNDWAEVPSPVPGPSPGPPPPAWSADQGGPATTTQQGAAGSGHPGSGSAGAAGPGGFGAGGLGGLGGAAAGGGADQAYGGRGFGPAAGVRGPHGPGGPGRGFGGLAGQAAAAEAAAARGAGGARGGGMLYPPVGGAAGRDEDREKPLASYVMADDDLFDDDRVVAPPVFGA